MQNTSTSSPIRKLINVALGDPNQPHSTAQASPTFPPLEWVTRPTVDTASAAYYLNRRPQTLRCWAVYQNGAVNPIRISGRLAWPVTELRRVLGVQQ